MQGIADRINAEIKLGLFSPARYLYFFPQGNAAAYFRGRQVERTAPTVADYCVEWLERRRRERGRKAVLDSYESALGQINAAVLPLHDGHRQFGTLPLDQLTTEHLTLLRAELLTTRKVQSVRTYMLSALRAVLRDARDVSGWVTGDPFARLSRWPRERVQKPDPFTAEERDTILAWFKRRDPQAYPFVLFQFHTGCRPGEAVGLRWGNVDVRGGSVQIVTSRTAGQDNAPKTAASERTIRLTSLVATMLRALMPLHVGPEDHVFLLDGQPINQDSFRDGPWRRALRATEVRARKLYATRHTFMSVAISAGCNTKWLAGYCGTSPTMIDRHYAIYLPPEEDQLARLEPPAATGAEVSAADRATS